MLRVENLNVSFLNSVTDEWTSVITDINFTVEKGEVLGIVGESGCGKSVTLRALMGLTQFSGGRVESGSVYFEDQSMLDLSEKKWRRLRGKRITMIHQDPMSSLNPLMKCGDQVAEGLLEYSKCGKAFAKKKVCELFDEVGIPDSEMRYNQYPHELSGGLRQRVVIAMALITDPDLILADEPTTALDVTIQKQILEKLKSLQKKRNLSMVFITHDLGVIMDIADRVAVFYAGQKVEELKSSEMLEACRHPYTKGLLASIPKPYLVESISGIPGVVVRPENFSAGCRFAKRCPYIKDICKKETPHWLGINETHKVSCHHVKN